MKRIDVWLSVLVLMFGTTLCILVMIILECMTKIS